jgi:hypothetical protein
LFRELRRQDATIAEPPNEMARAALQAFAAFQRIIAPYADRTRVRQRATDRLLGSDTMPRELVELGALVLLVPPRLDPVDARLLAAIARWARLHTGFAEFDDSDELANALGTQGSFELESALDALGIRHQSSRVAAQLAGPEIGVIRAPDPAEEVREVVRSIARDMDGPAPVPLHQIAVLYRQTDPYGPLVRDSLSQAGLPWSALEGRTLAESRPGRALLQLLNVRERDFAR